MEDENDISECLDRVHDYIVQISGSALTLEFSGALKRVRWNDLLGDTDSPGAIYRRKSPERSG